MSEQIVFGIKIEGIDSTIKSQKELTDAIKETKKQLASKEIDSPEYKKLEKTLGQLTAAQNNFRNNARTAAKEAMAGANSTAGAYRKMSAQLALSRDRLKDLAAAGQTNTKEFKNLTAEVSKLDKELKKIDANAGQFQRNVGNYTSALGGLANFFTGGLLVGGIAAVTKGLFDLGVKAIEAADAQEKAVAKVANLVKQTGEAAGFTTNELEKMAAELQKNSLFGDEQILNEVTAQLLTFTNVAGEEFSRAQQAALDLATVLDGDLQGASIQLGKALNDPVKGMSALSRSGVSFTEQQKDMVKELVASGDTIGAQNLILNELERQYGGAAKAASEAGTGGFKQLQNAFNDLLEPMGRALIDLGDFLLPVLKLIPGLIENAFGIIQRVFAPVIESVQRLISRFEGAVDWTEILTGAIEFLLLPIKTFGVILGAVIDFVDALVVAYQNAQKESEEFREASLGIENFFKELYKAILNIPAVLNGVMRALGQLMTNIKNLDFSTSIIGAFNEGFDAYKAREAGKQGEDIANEVAKGTAKDLAKNLGDELDKNKSDLKKAGEKGIGEPLVEGSLAALKQAISEMKKEIENLAPDDPDFFEKMLQLDKREKEFKELEESYKRITARMAGEAKAITDDLPPIGMPTKDRIIQTVNDHKDGLERMAANQKAAMEKQKELDRQRLEERKEQEKELANFMIDIASEIANAQFAILKNQLDQQKALQLDALDFETQKRLESVERGSAEEAAILQEQKDKEAEIEAEARRKQQRLDIQQALINGALAITKTFANLGFPAGLLGAAFVAAQTAAQIGVIRSQGFAEGGFTGYGGKYEPAGTVHRGEVVWNQRDVAAVGGPSVADRMRPTYKGYAKGGIVGSFTGGTGAISDRETAAIEAAVRRGSEAGTKQGAKEASSENRRLERLNQNIAV